MGKIAVAILGRLVFANYNAFSLGSVVLFVAVGLALLLGGNNGKPSPMHVAAESIKTAIPAPNQGVEGASTTSIMLVPPMIAPPSTSTATPPKPSKKSKPLLAIVPVSEPVVPLIVASSPTPVSAPPSAPQILNPTPTPPMVASVSIAGPEALNIALGGSAAVPFSTSDGSSVTWTLVSPATNTTGPIFIFPDVNPVTGSSFTFSLVTQVSALLGDKMTFTVHAVDASRGIDLTKSIVVTVIAASVSPSQTVPASQ